MKGANLNLTTLRTHALHSTDLSRNKLRYLGYHVESAKGKCKCHIAQTLRKQANEASQGTVTYCKPLSKGQ